MNNQKNGYRKRRSKNAASAMKVGEFRKSTQKNKKYMVKTPLGKIVHFGDKRYPHFEDTTPLRLYKKYDHKDPERQKNYVDRHSGVKRKDGTLVVDDPESASYYSMRYLWGKR